MEIISRILIASALVLIYLKFKILARFKVVEYFFGFCEFMIIFFYNITTDYLKKISLLYSWYLWLFFKIIPPIIPFLIAFHFCINFFWNLYLAIVINSLIYTFIPKYLYTMCKKKQILKCNIQQKEEEIKISIILILFYV